MSIAETYLEARNPETGCARAYRVTLTRDLFGVFMLRRGTAALALMVMHWPIPSRKRTPPAASWKSVCAAGKAHRSASAWPISPSLTKSRRGARS